jgi:hypothetical protein
MRTRFNLVVQGLFLLVFGLATQAQVPPGTPVLNEPDMPPCEDPANTAECSQDFYWNAPISGEPVGWYEIFRQTEEQTGAKTAWTKVGNAPASQTRWWTAQDAGDSGRNQQGEIRAGQQKPGFIYHYRVRACRLVPNSWTISCGGFTAEYVTFIGVVYERVTG